MFFFLLLIWIPHLGEPYFGFERLWHETRKRVGFLVLKLMTRLYLHNTATALFKNSINIGKRQEKRLLCRMGGHAIEISEDIVRPRTIVLFSLSLHHVGPSWNFLIMQNNGANEGDWTKGLGLKLVTLWRQCFDLLSRFWHKKKD